VILFDRCGTGSSDLPSGVDLPSWERWAEEARAVLDAVNSGQAVVFGTNDAGPTAILFAASHPDRTRGLILSNTTARFAAAPDYPGGIPEDKLAVMAEFVQQVWGTEKMLELSGETDPDPEYVHWWTSCQRLSLGPREASKLLFWEQSTDVRQALSAVRVPTLVFHRAAFQAIPAEQGRYLAEHIEGARFILLPGSAGGMGGSMAHKSAQPSTEFHSQIDEFLDALGGPTDTDRALATILFTDIVRSTELVASLGDRDWRELLESHNVIARAIINRNRGRLVKSTGDGLLATFDGPGRAIRCATALGEALRPLGIEIRAGLHTGEVEVTGDDLAGIGVHIAARILDAAGEGEVLVSAAIPMLVAGSGFEFDDRGERQFKGVPGSCRLFAVTS
jgi:class 3 adenylate cyclase